MKFTHLWCTQRTPLQLAITNRTHGIRWGRGRWVSLLLGLGSLLYLGHEVFLDRWGEFAGMTWPRGTRWVGPFLGVLMLWPLNWGLEALKWRFLLRRHWSAPWGQAWRYTLAGTALALWTPGRLGQGMSWLWFMPAAARPYGVAAGLAGAIVQNLITALVAGAGLAIFLDWEGAAGFHHAATPVYLPAMGLLLLAAAWAFHQHRLRLRLWWRKIRGATYLPRYPAADWLVLLLLGALRYSTYTLQFVLLCRGLGVDLPWLDMALRVGMLFALQGMAPTLAALEWSVRGSLTMLVFEGADVPMPFILMASMSLWAINLALPALWGGALWLRQGLRPHTTAL